MMLKADCRHFPGSRPCRFNKESGQSCSGCPHYQSKGTRILITKLDALGDVLRTTALLPGLKSKYPHSHIVWVTKAGAVDLFKNNAYIDELWIAETEAMARLQVERFDLVINTDADKWTAALATTAQGTERLGMMLDLQGNLCAANTETIEWMEMGAFDSLKKANEKTYQQIIYEICRLPYQGQRPVLVLNEAEMSWGSEFLKQQGYSSARRLIGLNVGGGGRWKCKRWTEEHILTFSSLVAKDPNFQLLLIGGPWERELCKRLIDHLDGKVIFSGTDRSLRELAAIITQCETLVTGDTLALHMATALHQRVIALFGPTSAAEIEVYNNGVKFISDLDCYCCYRTDCHRTPNCMSLITPQMIYQALRE